ncbi:hypothetical protein ACSTLN_23605, partial [Vibrio parahaemolyticus]
ENCLVQQPEYATAHENLGDVYPALVAGSCTQALSPNRAGGDVREKLALVSRISKGSNIPPAAH